MIYTGGNVLARGLNFIIQVSIWSNLFSPDAYGQIAYCYVFISFMAVILPLGIDAAFMNYYVRGKNKAAYLKNTIFLISTLAFSFFLVAMLLKQQLAPITIRQDSGKLLAISLGILFFDIMNNQGLLYLRAEGKAMLSVILQNIEIAVRLVLLLVLVFFLIKRYPIYSLGQSGVVGCDLYRFSFYSCPSNERIKDIGKHSERITDLWITVPCIRYIRSNYRIGR